MAAISLSGMGADCARALASDGFKVGILSSSGKGEALAKEWGRIDVLVNSAGHGPRAPV